MFFSRERPLLISDLGEAPPPLPRCQRPCHQAIFFKINWHGLQWKTKIILSSMVTPLPADIMLIFYCIFQKYF